MSARTGILLRIAGLSSALLASSIAAAAEQPLRVIDETAIPLTRVLSKADFDQRFPGKQVDDSSKLEPGWYVVYRHESLNYHFGPIQIEATGRDYLDELRAIVAEAVVERPDLEDYTIELKQLPKRESKDSGTAAPTPKKKRGFWSAVKRIFGF